MSGDVCDLIPPLHITTVGLCALKPGTQERLDTPDVRLHARHALAEKRLWRALLHRGIQSQAHPL